MTSPIAPFLIISDVDGVLIHDNTPIPNALKAFPQLLQHWEESYLPTYQKRFGETVSVERLFYCLTNGGGQTEMQRATLMNQLFDLEDFFHHERTFLAHTVIGRRFLDEYKDKKILVISRDTMGNVLESYGFKNVEYIWEFVEKHPYLFPYSSNVHQEFGKRNGTKNEKFVPTEDLWKQEPIEAIFVLQNPVNWNDSAQAICDLLVSDGRVGCNRWNSKFNFYPAPEGAKEHNESLRSSASSGDSSAPDRHSQMPLIFCNPDLTYAGEFKAPRFTEGAFRVTVETLFRELHGEEIQNLHMFGKPLESTFDFVKEEIRRHLSIEKLPERIYFIGDNPRSDILGANLAGMFSILVRTGCFQSTDDNDAENPGRLVCENFEEAIKFIMREELRLLVADQESDTRTVDT